MNRIITILVTIFILLLLYIWISHVWGSDKPKHPRQIVDAKETQIADDLIADADTMQMGEEMKSAGGLQEEDAQKEEKNTADDPKTPKAEEKKVVTPNKTESKPVQKKAKESVETKSKPAPTQPKTTPTSENNASTTGEEHLVIAGNFTQKTNAEQRVKELQKAGFAKTEVVNFDLSEYFTVCVGRFSDVNEARRLVKKLKDYHKIDAYVRIGG